MKSIRLESGTRFNTELRNRILNESDPVGFLMNVMNGEPMSQLIDGQMTLSVPDARLRVEAAKHLLKKVMPDLKAVEVSDRSSNMTYEDRLLEIVNGQKNPKVVNQIEG